MTNQEINKRAAWWNVSPSTLQQFADQVAADEREACAKVCESFEDDMGYGKAQKCADAIRARGNK